MRIALVTDTHLSPKDTVLQENWVATSRWIAATAPDIVVHLGDITANGVHDAGEFHHARALLAPAGQDILFLPGNHDIGDNPTDDGQPSDEPFDPDRLCDYRRVFGADWWSFHVEAWQIIGLNAQLFGTGSKDEAEQRAWLEETIAIGEGPLGLMIHKPLHPIEPAPPPRRYAPAKARRTLASLLQSRDLRFVVSGHTHQALHIQEGRTEHAWVPSTAFCIPDAMQERIGEKRVGAMLLMLEPDGHRLIDAMPAGLTRHNLLDLDHIYPEVAALRAAFGEAATL